MDGNIFKSNRKGKRLCEEFNRGNCPSHPGSDFCPKNPSFMRQCSRCLGASHGLSTCSRTDQPALKPQYGKGDKGKGKGGKGGKSGKKNRWQY